MKFLRGKLAIAIFVELEKRFRCGLEFLGGDGAVSVGVQCGDHRGRRSVAGRAITVSGDIVTFGAWRRRRTHFVAGDCSIAVLVELGEGAGCILDFLCRKHSIAVSVEDREDRRDRRRAVALLSQRILDGGDTSQQGDGQMNGLGFHGLFRFR